jgi:hypothetical protein
MPASNESLRRCLFGIRFRVDFAIVTLIGVVALAAYSVYLGKDANYDLHNYHYYGCYCFEKARLGFDVYAAQSQSYLNPIGYLPFCWAVDHLRPIAVGILFGGLDGLSLGLLYALSWTVLSGASPRSRMWLSLLTAVAGVCSPLFLGVVGSSFTDSWTPLLIVLGLCAGLRSNSSLSWRFPFAAGAALGLATGFKLVNGVYALALLLTLGATYVRQGWLRRITSYCAGGLIGALLVAGPWALALNREFQSPLFPYFNAILKSPYSQPTNDTDRRWLASSPDQALEYPFLWAGGDGTRSLEVPFRDLRFAIFFILLLPALAVSIRRPAFLTKEAESADSQPLFDPVSRKLILCFFVVSYLLWLYGFGSQRYATPLELLSGLAILALCDCLFADRSAKQRAFVVLALVGIFWVKAPDWGRRPWGTTWFDTPIPSELRTGSTLYVIPDSAASAFLIPMLPADSRFVRIESNGRALPPDRWLGPRVQRIIARHHGPMRVLEGDSFNLQALAGYGLSVNRQDCLVLYTGGAPLTVCSAYRTADGAASAVRLADPRQAGRLALPEHLRATDSNHAGFQDGWLRSGPVVAPPDDVRPRGRFDNQVTLTLKPPEGATQISGEVHFIPDRDNASIIVDMIWYHGLTEVGRANPSTNVDSAGHESVIPLLMERPSGADSIQLCVRPWRDVDGVVTVAGGFVKWSTPN